MPRNQFSRWLRQTGSRGSAARTKHKARLRVETLESREVPADVSPRPLLNTGGGALAAGAPPARPVFDLSSDQDDSLVGDRTTSFGTVTLVGQTTRGATVTIKGKSAVADKSGRFAVADVPLAMGLNKLTAVASLNGLQSSYIATITRAAVPAGTVVLQESGDFLAEATIPVTLGVVDGTRTLRFDLGTSFSRKDHAASGDVLLVSLIDSNNQVLLGSRGAGSPLLIVSETGSEFRPGLVQFDGHAVEIDVSAIAATTDGQLLFQLVSTDTDSGSEVHIGPVANTVVDGAEPGPMLPALPDAGSTAGAAVTLSAFKAMTTVKVLVENVRFDDATKRFTADLRLRNDGTATASRSIAVVLPGLPAGVQILNPSGTTAAGTPYLNFIPAMPAGGLMRGETSGPLHVVLDNPALTRFALRPTILGSPNKPPKIDPIKPQTVFIGGHLELKFHTTDPNGDPIQYHLQANSLPTGKFRPDGTLIIAPKPGELGKYAITIIADDGSATAKQTFQLTVAADPLTTTRVSGFVYDVSGTPIKDMAVTIGSVSRLTLDDGSFLLDLGAGPPLSETLRIGDVTNLKGYPFIGEKLPLLLEHDVYTGFNNVIARPIYLPPLVLTPDNSMLVDPTRDQSLDAKLKDGKTVSITVNAGTLLDRSGQPFGGTLSITEVPAAFTPASLPKNLHPDTVVTVQPGDMVFATPAPLTFPNRAGYAPGTIMDLWSINPASGVFDDVGDMIVTPDGQSIVTTSGGVRNSSWHLPAPQPDEGDDPNKDPKNEKESCDKAGASSTSEVELHSGALQEEHALVTYQSLGETRGLTLHYDSLRADPEPILTFGYSGVFARSSDRLVAGLTVKQGGFSYPLPGAAPGMGLTGGEHIWQMDKSGNVEAALQADFRTLPSGMYDYELTTGILTTGAGSFNGTSTTQKGTFQVVNTRGGAFGNGWGLSGLYQIVENADGSILLINGAGGDHLFGAPLAAGQPYVSPEDDFTTFIKLGDGTYRRTFTDQTVMSFDAQGRMTSIKDRNANETKYAYGPSGISKMTDPVGLVTTFTYTNGRVTKITDPAGRATTLTYDAAGNLIKVRDPDGATRVWEYDGEARMTGETDARGFHESTKYDLGGRVAGSVLKDGKVLSFSTLQTQSLQPDTVTSDPATAPAMFIKTTPKSTHTDADGHVTETILDRSGQWVSSRDDGGRLGTVARDNQNLIISSLDGLGFSTEYEHDSRGNVQVITDFVGSAEGGSLFVTGHDADDHGNGDYQRAGLDFLQFGRAARSAAEITARAQTKVGYLGNSDGSQGGEAVSGYTNRTFIDLDNVNWADQAFGGGFDILMVGTGGDFVFSNGSAALNAEADRFADYFNSGGGIFVNTDQAIIGQSFYNFLPRFGATQAALGGVGVYTATDAGLAIGLTEDIIDRDQTHTEYKSVDTTLFTVFETHNVSGDAVAIGLSRGVIGENGFARATRKYDYDPTFSRVTKITDGRDKETHFDLVAGTGNVAKMSRIVGLPDSPANGETDDLATNYTYTSNGLVDLMTDQLGRVTDYDYDAFGRLTKATYAKGTADQAIRSYAYDLSGNQTSMTDENGHTTRSLFDAMNRLIRTIEADPDGSGPLAGPVTDYGYDFNGNLVRTVDARGNITKNAYDAKNRLILTTQPDPDGAGPRTAPIVRYGYDKSGNLVSVTDPLGKTTNHEYDGRNRRVTTIDPDNGVTHFAYDTDNNLTKVTDPGGNVTTFAYDSRNRLIKETDPLGKATLYAYDAANNLISKTDRDGRKTDYEYDDLNRLTKETWQVAGQPAANVINYTYDAVGNLLTVADAFSSLAMTYDSRNRVKTVSNAGTPGTPTVALAYSYDSRGNVKTVGDTINGSAGASTTYAYDDLNRLTRLTQAGIGVGMKRVDFGYNSLGQYTQIAGFAGTASVANTTFAYDAMNRLTALTHQHGPTKLAGYGYSYDSDSRITSINSVRDGIVDYTYDDRDELTGADYVSASIPDELYKYDANGNRTESSRHGTSYVTDPNTANRLKSDGTFNYEYDDEGNLTKRTEIATGATREFTWDHRNRLTAITDKTSGAVVTQDVAFTYDALNRRISKSVNGATLRFVYDREDVLLDFAGGSATPAVRYLHGPGIDQVLAEDHGGGDVRWLLGDHLGTTRDIINNAGVVLNHLVVDAYGNLLSQTDATKGTRYVFTGRELDGETGLQYYRARYYDPQTGRFISEDSVRFMIVNLLKYADNSPINWNDPLGLSPRGPNHIDLDLDPKDPADFLDRLKKFAEQQRQHGGGDAGHIEKLENALKQVKKFEKAGKVSKKIYKAARRVGKVAGKLGPVVALVCMFMPDPALAAEDDPNSPKYSPEEPTWMDKFFDFLDAIDPFYIPPAY